MPLDLDSICIEPLNDLHERAGFECADKGIQNFCRNGVARANRQNTIRAFVARQEESPAVLGFYYLTTTSIEHEAVGRAVQDRFALLDKVPAVYLGMLGVHEPLMRQGLGTLLMRDAFVRVLDISNSAGVFALTLDAVDEKAAGYYERFGFQRFTEAGLEMFIPLGTIQQLGLR